MDTELKIESWLNDCRPQTENKTKIDRMLRCWPPKTENKKKILDYLQRHRTMTMRQGFSMCNQPSEYVRRLRNEGYMIKTEWHKGVNGKRYGVYVLVEAEKKEDYPCECWRCVSRKIKNSVKL